MINFRNNEKATINAIYKIDDKQKQDRESVYRRYQQMKDAKQPFTDKMDKWDKQYDSWRPERDPGDWQSTIVPPFTTTIVEKSLAEIIDQTIQPVITPRGQEDVIKAKVMNYIKDYTWEIADGDLQLYMAIKQCLIRGNTIWQEDYWQDKRTVKVLKRFDPKTNKEEYIEKEIYDYDDVYGETIDIANFFIDPMARTINNGRYKANDAIRRYIMDYNTFQESFINSPYDQFGDAKLVKPGGDLNYYQFYKPPEGIDKENQVEVLWYWGRRPDKLIIVANDVVIRNGPNPYNHKQLPFAEGMDIPRISQFWAKGEPELLESIQDELTTLRRMRIDRQHMDLWKMFLVSNRETLDEDDAIIAPSRFLYVDDPFKSVNPLEYRDINPSAYMEEDRLKSDGREVSGIESPQVTGTATQAAIFKEATMKSLRMKIWLLSRQLLTNIIRLRVPNISQYYSTPKALKIVGEKQMAEYRQIRTTDVALQMNKNGELKETEQKGENFFVVMPELVTPQYGSFDFKLSGQPTFPVSKPMQQQKIAEFMQHPVFQQAVATGYYDPGKAADELSKINDYDPDKFKSMKAQDQDSISLDTVLELANRENEMMTQGQAIPGTPNAPRSHTDVHLAYMSSQPFLDAMRTNPAVMQNFIRHIMWEEKAQMARNQATIGPQSNILPGQAPGPGGMGQGMSEGIERGAAQAATPAKSMGPSANIGA